MTKYPIWPQALFCVFIFCLGCYIYKSRQAKRYGNRVVICVPVYGQSYALGEEATRITNFDSLRIKYDGRIVTGRYIRMIYKYLVDGIATGRFQYDGLKANAAIEWIETHCFHTEGPLAPGP